MTRWLSPLMDICQDTGQDKGNAYRRLQDLVAAGLVVRDGDGQGAQYRPASNGTG